MDPSIEARPPGCHGVAEQAGSPRTGRAALAGNALRMANGAASRAGGAVQDRCAARPPTHAEAALAGEGGVGFDVEIGAAGGGQVQAHVIVGAERAAAPRLRFVIQSIRWGSISGGEAATRTQVCTIYAPASQWHAGQGMQSPRPRRWLSAAVQRDEARCTPALAFMPTPHRLMPIRQMVTPHTMGGNTWGEGGPGRGNA